MGNLLKYEGSEIHVIEEDDKLWFKALYCAKILGYNNAKESIRYNVDKTQARKLGSFSESPNFLPLKGNAKSTIYISKEGLFSLILNSMIKGAKKFKQWISKILDKIDDGEEIYENKYVNDHDFNINPCDKYEDWALTHNTNQYKDENVFYLGCMGTFTNIKNDVDTNIKENSLVFKFGISADEFQRTSQHMINIDNYVCFYVVKCDRYNKLEKYFKMELKRKNTELKILQLKSK